MYPFKLIKQIGVFTQTTSDFQKKNEKKIQIKQICGTVKSSEPHLKLFVIYILNAHTLIMVWLEDIFDFV